MKLAELTWPQVADLDRDTVVIIPTGSLEQHGPHLPLFTDSLLVTAATNALEANLPNETLVTPTLWLGASTHHLAFPGSLSHTTDSYIATLTQTICSLANHGFHRFYIVNGHGGNTDLNSLTLRNIKSENPNLTLGHAGYFQFIPTDLLAQTLTGPTKTIRHACEAETSLMLHLHPNLVHQDKLRDDGLEPTPSVPGLVFHFDQITEHGSLGHATQANPQKGEILFQAAVQGLTNAVKQLHTGIFLQSPES